METIKLPPLPTDADVYNQAACPSRLILDRIADKWTTLIMGILEQSEHRRFNELRRLIGGISQKMLTQTLRDLERDGLVKRTIFPEVPPARRIRADGTRPHALRAARLAHAVGARPYGRGQSGTNPFR